MQITQIIFIFIFIYYTTIFWFCKANFSLFPAKPAYSCRRKYLLCRWSAWRIPPAASNRRGSSPSHRNVPKYRRAWDCPPLIPKTGPNEGSLKAKTDFFPILFNASESPIEIVVFPSPNGVGLIAVTNTSFPSLLFLFFLIKCYEFRF